MTEGNDALLIATGSMVYRALEAAKLLAGSGISCTVVDMHTIKPLDINLLCNLAPTHRYIFTLEEHSIYGGLGEAVAAQLFQYSSASLTIIGVEDTYPLAGEYEYLIEQAGLSIPMLVNRIKAVVLGG